MGNKRGKPKNQQLQNFFLDMALVKISLFFLEAIKII